MRPSADPSRHHWQARDGNQIGTGGAGQGADAVSLRFRAAGVTPAVSGAAEQRQDERIGSGGVKSAWARACSPSWT